MPLPLGERMKQLRKERGWSQADLAERVETDARQISRYENGRITPSLDALIRIAEAFDISVDYLLIEDASRRPLHPNDHGLGARLDALGELDDEDRTTLLGVLDALITKSRLRGITQDLG